ncbi:contractile injection system protein, VgrG/Pvc8 family [Paenibacillus sp. Leaf72]|uniref:contractile injection system protein, VgrG/Pvc8 family n=1 Tax=Paenibacillus sp. Leaf72 TaxID=1736234 RepID=UPI0006FC6874|nr:contractile injection system protein, VgrG/Pvc8 family [Paenibacillus sp. Leaf72]KQO01094.1 hypothetical protein ASF12_14670 [Paenibacillus sp. Leaf72]
MTDVMITYQNVKLAPYEMVNLQELTMTKKLNEHTYVKLTGIVPEEKKHSYVEMTDANTQIEISQMDDEGIASPLFCGIVLDIEIKVVRGIYYMELEAVSHTYKLDIKRKSRSFQNQQWTYPQLLKYIGADYEGMEVLDEATAGGSIGQWNLQYQETDWEFLKRLASRVHTSLMPAAVFNTPKIYFGVYEGDEKAKLSNFHYEVEKKMSTFRYFSEHEGANVNENDFIFYKVETDSVFDLGSMIAFNGKQMYVCEAESTMTGGIMKHRYTLCSHRGLRHRMLYNEPLVGASIQGKVIGLSGDKVQVHLSIDKEQNKEEAHWFSYSSMYTAEGSSGWYCMPELGDHVQIYFPSSRETDGLATGSVRQNSKVSATNKLGNPAIKYFRTASGKEVKLAPDELVVTAKDGDIYIRLSDKDGIEIHSSKPIKLNAAADITMNAGKKLVLSAKEEINLSCKKSELKMDGNTTITGLELKTN